MNKAALAAKVAEKTGITKKQATELLDTFVDTITEEIASGEKVSIVGFGTFEVKERASHIGRNPATGEAMQINTTKSPVFRAGKSLKDAVK